MTDEKRGRGRPPLADEDRRDARLEVRLSAAEAALLFVWAARLKKPTAEAVREAAIAAASSAADSLSVRRVTAEAPAREEEEEPMSRDVAKPGPAKITWAPTEIPAAFSVAESTVRRDIASGAPSESPLLSIAGVLSTVPIARSTLYRHISRGDLTPIRVGRRVFVRRADLARWLGIPETDLANAR